VDALGYFVFGECSKTLLMSPGKEVIVFAWIIDVEMVLKPSNWICEMI
jgi:hypothetical protein